MESWYLQLADAEGLNRRSVVVALAKAVQRRLTEQQKEAHLGKRITSLDVVLLTVKDVAGILQVSEETVRRYVDRKVLTTVDFPGGAIRFDPRILLEELNGYLRPSKFLE